MGGKAFAMRRGLRPPRLPPPSDGGVAPSEGGFAPLALPHGGVAPSEGGFAPLALPPPTEGGFAPLHNSPGKVSCNELMICSL